MKLYEAEDKLQILESTFDYDQDSDGIYTIERHQDFNEAELILALKSLNDEAHKHLKSMEKNGTGPHHKGHRGEMYQGWMAQAIDTRCDLLAFGIEYG